MKFYDYAVDCLIFIHSIVAKLTKNNIPYQVIIAKLKHMKNINIAFYLIIAITAFLFSCEKQEGEEFLKRNIRALAFSYQEEQQEFTIRATGNWRIDIPEEFSWISVSPQTGTGDGVTYEKITVSCTRNISDERQGKLLLSGSGQSDVEITVTQSNGLFEWSTHANGAKIAIRNNLRVNTNSTAAIAVPYSKAVGDETVDIEASITGKGAEGLSIPQTTATITEEGDGYLLIPIEGTATQQGGATISLKVDGEDFGEVTTLVGIGETILRQNFDLLLWGGDAIGNRPGVSSVNATNDLSMNDETVPVAIGTNGANGSGVTSTIRTSNPTFYAQIGLQGWLGLRNYMRPGYLQLGATSATDNQFGSLISPGLDIPAGQSYDIHVKLKIGLYNDPVPERLMVGLYPKDITGLNTNDLSRIIEKVYIPSKIGFHRWVEVSCVVPNATNNMALLLSLPEELLQNNVVQAGRIYVDDIEVSY